MIYYQLVARHGWYQKPNDRCMLSADRVLYLAVFILFWFYTRGMNLFDDFPKSQQP